MQRRLTLLVLSGFLTGLAAAQEMPRLEVFGGYQYLHAGNFDGLGDGSANTHGWNAAATFRVASHIGVTADFSGNYQTKQVTSSGLNQTATAHIHIYTYGVGPTVSFSAGRHVNLFAHALFGNASVRPTACVIFSGSPDECGAGNATGFAMMFGGGVDVPASARTALRIVQVDWVYLPSEFGAQTHDVRVSSGLVFHF